MTIHRTALLTAAVAALALTGTATAAAAPRVIDIDAELTRDGRLHLQAETAGATRATFLFDGRSISGRVTEIDREDGTRDWESIVPARGVSTGTKTFRVRACDANRCTTRSMSVRVERDDD